MVPHPGKPEAVGAARHLIERLEALQAQAWLDEEGGRRLGRPELVLPAERWGELQVVIVLGGDGALLNTARLLAPYRVPLLGVNVGRLGFLAELELSELDAYLERLLRGEFRVEDRMMIDVAVQRGEAQVGQFVALNDCVISRGTVARIILLETWVQQQCIGTFRADGIIIATPTGSTAYSLSAGGPIVHPMLDSLIVTPICPHTLAARPVVVPPQEAVEVRVRATHQDIMLTVDGQITFRLQPGDAVAARRSELRTRLVKLSGRSLYEVLRTRLSHPDL